jgi:transposase
MNQESLEVQIPYTYTIRPDHIVRIISNFIDSLPSDMLLKNTPQTGCKAFHPAMLLKMTLFAYSQGQTSGRKIPQMNEENLPKKWLTQDTSISYRTINRFRVASSTQDLIKQMYLSFYAQLKEQDLVSDEAIFVDGTKINADANKYSFVWRKATEKKRGQVGSKNERLI